MVGASDNDRLVWIDCEMTGLDLAVDELVEIAVVVTDFELRPLDPGFSIVIKPDASALAHMNDFVTDDAREVRPARPRSRSGVSVAEAEFEALEYIQRFVPLEGKAPLAGNTIGTDRMFLAKYMPRVDRWLHYRNVDVSSIKELSPALVSRARTSTRRRRAAVTALSPTSANPSWNWPTTARRCSSPSPARPATERVPRRPPPFRRSLPEYERIFGLPARAGDMVGIAQLVERWPCGGRCRGFEPRYSPQ